MSKYQKSVVSTRNAKVEVVYTRPGLPFLDYLRIMYGPTKKLDQIKDTSIGEVHCGDKVLKFINNPVVGIVCNEGDVPFPELEEKYGGNELTKLYQHLAATQSIWSKSSADLVAKAESVAHVEGIDRLVGCYNLRINMCATLAVLKNFLWKIEGLVKNVAEGYIEPMQDKFNTLLGDYLVSVKITPTVVKELAKLAKSIPMLKVENHVLRLFGAGGDFVDCINKFLSDVYYRHPGHVEYHGVKVSATIFYRNNCAKISRAYIMPPKVVCKPDVYFEATPATQFQTVIVEGSGEEVHELRQVIGEVPEGQKGIIVLSDGAAYFKYLGSDGKEYLSLWVGVGCLKYPIYVPEQPAAVKFAEAVSVLEYEQEEEPDIAIRCKFRCFNGNHIEKDLDKAIDEIVFEAECTIEEVHAVFYTRMCEYFEEQGSSEEIPLFEETALVDPDYRLLDGLRKVVRLVMLGEVADAEDEDNYDWNDEDAESQPPDVEFEEQVQDEDDSVEVDEGDYEEDTFNLAMGVPMIHSDDELDLVCDVDDDELVDEGEEPDVRSSSEETDLEVNVQCNDDAGWSEDPLVVDEDSADTSAQEEDENESASAPETSQEDMATTPETSHNKNEVASAMETTYITNDMAVCNPEAVVDGDIVEIENQFSSVIEEGEKNATSASADIVKSAVGLVDPRSDSLTDQQSGVGDLVCKQVVSSVATVQSEVVGEGSPVHTPDADALIASFTANQGVATKGFESASNDEESVSGAESVLPLTDCDTSSSSNSAKPLQQRQKRLKKRKAKKSGADADTDPSNYSGIKGVRDDCRDESAQASCKSVSSEEVTDVVKEDEDWGKAVDAQECKNLAGQTKPFIFYGDLQELLKQLGGFGSIIINAANERLQHGGGFAKAVASLAGQLFIKKCEGIIRTKGPVPMDTRMVQTGPYNCSMYGVKAIRNAVAPRGNEQDIEAKLNTTYYHAIQDIVNKPEVIITPLLGAGIFNVDPELSLKALLRYATNNVVIITNEKKQFEMLKAHGLIEATFSGVKTSAPGTSVKSEKELDWSDKRTEEEEANVSGTSVKDISTPRSEAQVVTPEEKINEEPKPEKAEEVKNYWKSECTRELNLGAVRGLNGIYKCKKSVFHGSCNNPEHKGYCCVCNGHVSEVVYYSTFDGVNYKTHKFSNLGKLVKDVIGDKVYVDGVCVDNKPLFEIQPGSTFLRLYPISEADKQHIRDINELSLKQYGVFAAVYAREHPIIESGGLRYLKQKNNNCFVSTALVMLQHLKLEFKGIVKELWSNFLAGDARGIVAYTYALLYPTVKYGDMGDAEEVVLKYLNKANLCAQLTLNIKCKCGERNHTFNGVDAVYCIADVSTRHKALTSRIVCACNNVKSSIVYADLPFVFVHRNVTTKIKLEEDFVCANVFKHGSHYCGTNAMYSYDSMSSKAGKPILESSFSAIVFEGFFKANTEVSEAIDEAIESGVDIHGSEENQDADAGKQHAGSTFTPPRKGDTRGATGRTVVDVPSKGDVGSAVKTVESVSNAISVRQDPHFHVNNFEVLSVQSLPAESADPVVKKASVVTMKGDFKPFKVGNTTVKPGKGPQLEEYLTLDVIKQAWITGDYNVVIRRTSTLTKMLGVVAMDTGKIVFDSMLKAANAIIDYAKRHNLQKKAIQEAKEVATMLSPYMDVKVVKGMLFNVWSYLLTVLPLLQKPTELYGECLKKSSKVVGGVKASTWAVMGLACMCWWRQRQIAAGAVRLANWFTLGYLCYDYNTYSDYHFNVFDYCNGTLCELCLSGVDSLHLYKHAKTTYQKVVTTDFVGYAPLYFILQAVFFKSAAMLSGLLFMIKFTINFGVFNTGIYIVDYVVSTIANTIDPIMISTIVCGMIKLYRMANHYFYGCKNPACDRCHAANVSERTELSCVVGSKRFPYYVYANSVAKMCSKHMWCCKNCDVFGEGNTFISTAIVGDLTDKIRRKVKATSEALAIATLVEEGDNYELHYKLNGAEGSRVYDKNQFWNCAIPVSDASKCGKFEPDNFITYNASSQSELSLAKQCAVYYAQVLSRPTIIVPLSQEEYTSGKVTRTQVTRLLDLCDDYYGISDAEVKMSVIKSNTGATLSAAVQQYVAKIVPSQVMNLDVDFLLFCDRYGLTPSQAAYNNAVPNSTCNLDAYEGEQFLRVKEQVKSAFVQFGVKYVDFKMALNDSKIAILQYDFLKSLPGNYLPSLLMRIRQAGVTLRVTTSQIMQQDTLGGVRVTMVEDRVSKTQKMPKKKGGNPPSWIQRFFNFMQESFKMSLIGVLLGALMISLIAPTFTPSVVELASSGYKVIDNGVIRPIVETDNCFANKYAGFNDWYYGFVGRYPYNSVDCPVVVALTTIMDANMKGAIVPGYAGNMAWLNGQIVHYRHEFSWFTGSSAEGIVGYTRDIVVYGEDFIKSLALISARCVKLMMVSERLYCYGGSNDAIDALPFTAIQPHVVYNDAVGVGKLVVPEQLLYKPYIVYTQAREYCRAGVCEQAKEGYCINFNGEWALFNQHYTSKDGVYCGETPMSVVMSIINAYIYQGTTTSFFNRFCVLSVMMLLALIALVYVVKFQAFFKTYAGLACAILLSWGFNAIMLLSYSVNPIVVMPLIVVYMYVALTVTTPTAMIMHVAFLVTIVPMLPYSLMAIYGAYVLLMYTSVACWFVKTKVSSGKLFEKGEFVADFDTAARSTFLINNSVYVKLVNEVGDKFQKYLSGYARLKYYSGSGGDQECLDACRATLANALENFKNTQVEVLYTPPRFGVNLVTRLQAGIKKMVAPSSAVEQCVVSVVHGNTQLNGLWLNDYVLCPRHILGKYTGEQWRDALINANNFDFHILYKGMELQVVGRELVGALLKLKVSMVNANTPKYKFAKARIGDNFSIACAYNGHVSGLYTVTLRENGTLKGSFMSGSCGSVGYNVTNEGVEFVYMHHLELPGCVHGGSDLHGMFYGGYVDEEVLQRIPPAPANSRNIVAWLYAAVYNNCDWFVKYGPKQVMSVEDFNEWASGYGFTKFEYHLAFDVFSAATGVSVEQMLAALKELADGWNYAPILGSFHLDDEYSPEMIMQQTSGIVLQSNVKKATKGFLSRLGYWLVMVILTVYASCNVVPLDMLPQLIMSVGVGFVIMFVTLKHQHFFMTTAIIPYVVTSILGMALEKPVFYNGWYFSFFHDFLKYVGIEATHQYAWMLLPFALYVAYNVAKGVGSTLINFNAGGISLWNSLVYGMRWGSTLRFLYTALMSDNVFETFGSSGEFYINMHMACVGLFSSDPASGYIIMWIVKQVNYVGYLAYFTELSYYTFVFYSCVLCYMFSCYFGLFWFTNKVLGTTFGKYPYKVSAGQFKYMMLNGMRGPRSTADVLITNMRLAGIGGERTITVSTVQSKLTDVKCATVVLMQLLTKLNVEANSRLHKHLVQTHNDILAESDPAICIEKLTGMLMTLLSIDSTLDVKALCDELLAKESVLQAVTDEFCALPSYVDYEKARAAYEEIQKNSTNPQEIKAYKKAMNIAKSVLDRDIAVQKKLDAMAERAMSTMYKEAKSSEKKTRLVSSLHALLFSMIKRLDSDQVADVFEKARNGVVPLASVPITCSNKLTIVIPDMSLWEKVVVHDYVVYGNIVWDINEVVDMDGNQILPCRVSGEASWPLEVRLVRNGKLVGDLALLQNNELLPTGIKKSPCVAGANQERCAVPANAYYTSLKGQHFVAAITSEDPTLKYASFTGASGNLVVVELEPPCKFGVKTPDGAVKVMHLYFVKNVKNIVRGMVLGALTNVVALQHGVSTESVENCGILSLCSFALDAKECYLEYIKEGGTPLSNCVKMLTLHTGSGAAVTVKPAPTPEQDSFGGASVCLYCRAHISHPGVYGVCQFKGKFVQIPVEEKDPVGFCLRNKICTVCQMWIGFGCQCDSLRKDPLSIDPKPAAMPIRPKELLGVRAAGENSQDSAGFHHPGLDFTRVGANSESLELQSVPQNYLNRVRGLSEARLRPCASGLLPDVVKRAFDLYNSNTAGMYASLKHNCARFQELDENDDEIDSFFVVKQTTPHNFEHEEKCYLDLKADCVAVHDFFRFEGMYNICRQRLTKYTMMDLCYAFRHFDPNDCDVLKEILVVKGCCEWDYFDQPNWYDPVENPDWFSLISRLGPIFQRALIKVAEFCDLMVEKGYIGVVTLDNQDLNGNFYDFGDFKKVLPGCGVPVTTSYYSYMMPCLTACDALASERFFEFKATSGYKQYDLTKYDFTEEKLQLFMKYFKYWDRTYHPNCVECIDDRCLIHCANFNILFATLFPQTAFGCLCKRVYIDGVPFISTTGYHSKELGVLLNKDNSMSFSKMSIGELMRFAADPSLLVSASDAFVDLRTSCFSLSALSTGLTYQTVKPGHFNEDFYNFAEKKGFFKEGSSIPLKHFFYIQDGNAAIADFDYYRFNKPTMVDIQQFLFCFEVTDKYFEQYDGGCIPANQVVVTNLDKSAGYPFNKFGKARLYYESLSYAEQDQLFELTKRNILPTITQINMKYAISAKSRARTVAGVSILSTMTNRQFHQKCLKSIVNTRNATVVIGTTKFYGGWDNMLRNLMRGVEDPVLMGWDYPKCDRAMPSLLRLSASLILARRHKGCCDWNERIYRLANEAAQVLSEVALSNGGLYVKPGGTSSGDATTAYANSAFNLFQATAANVAQLLATPTSRIYVEEVRALQHELYTQVYRRDKPDMDFVYTFYAYLNKHFSLMILSDDGVVCYNKSYAEAGMVASIASFREVLFYQNNVFMADSKCWTEEDVKIGPHEFCSQHSMLVEIDGEMRYLPYPDPSRILGACVFVDDVEKTEPVVVMERYVALAIDAYPLIYHENEEYGKVFYLLLSYIQTLYQRLSNDMLMDYSFVMNIDTSSKFWEEDFYRQMYESSPTLQASGVCVVCNSQTVLRCGNCLRKPFLCCKCCYDHVMETEHKNVLSINSYVCSVAGCGESNVCKLFLGGMSYFCLDHKPRLAIPLVSGGTVFGIYRATCSGSPDVAVFNKLATTDWKSIDSYVLANNCSDSLRRFAAETVKATEELEKQQYASAEIKEIVGEKELVLSWEPGKTRPPLNRNYVFTGYHFTRNGKTQLGEFTFEKSDSQQSVYYKATSTSKLAVGDLFVLTSHNISPLTAPTICNQQIYTKFQNITPNLFLSEAFADNIPLYHIVGKQRRTTVQGPPGSGKSHFAIGLAAYFSNARIVYTACSHAAVDALCAKAFKFLKHDDCTRVVPMRVGVDCFSDFKVNDMTRKYIFSTINALPEVSCDILLVDEVSMLTNYELSYLNQKISYQYVVYVGDPAQLPAPRTLLNGCLEPAHYNLVTNIMVSTKPDIFLAKCYRCPKEIVDTVSELVYEGKFIANNPVSGQCFKCVVNTGNSDVKRELGSAYNQVQLDFVADFLKHNPLWRKACFISPYNSMNQRARRQLGLEVQTVDSSQGSEYDYVIFAVTADSPHAMNINRFNVAVTRAKVGILVLMRHNDSFYQGLKFVEIEGPRGKLQSQTTGLFKICSRNFKGLPPAYAPTYIALDEKYKVGDSVLATLLKVDTGSCVPYSHLVSLLGFKFDKGAGSSQIVSKYSPFITRDMAIRNVRGWVGFDVEASHAANEHIGTNLPLMVGFSIGTDYLVANEGLVMTEYNDEFRKIPARCPPGDQFAYLKPLLHKGKPWNVIRPQIVRMMADHLQDISDCVVLVTWSHSLELTTMRYFCKMGKEQKCKQCEGRGCAYNSAAETFHCWKHSFGCDFLYNPYLVDVQQWGYSGNLSSNHDRYCNMHGNAHVASADAKMTRCLAVYDCFVKNINWDVEYPIIANEEDVNRCCRHLQKLFVKSVCIGMNYDKVHDIGNPKGIKSANGISFNFYDKDPVADNVIRLDYDYDSMCERFKDGLALFWNCNVNCYPDNALVCRFDTRTLNALNLPGCNGGSLYVNKHAFHTEKYDRSAFRNLKSMPFFFFDDSPCDVKLVNDVAQDLVALSARDCITRCNIGGAVCWKHAKAYAEFVHAYNTCTLAGFTFWVSEKFDPYVLWKKFYKLQSLDQLVANVVKRDHFDDVKDDVPYVITGDKVFYRKGLQDVLIFENKTSMATSIAFEYYARRNIDVIPKSAILYGLGVDVTAGFTLWDRELSQPVFNGVVDTSKVIDIEPNEKLCVLYDDRVKGSRQRFLQTKNAVLISTTRVKVDGIELESVRIPASSCQIDSTPVSTVRDGNGQMFVYVRKDGKHVVPTSQLFTEQRSFEDFFPLSVMERDFLNMEAPQFIAKYDCKGLGLEHVLYGDFSKKVIGGAHLTIGLARLYTQEKFDVHEISPSSFDVFKSYFVVTHAGAMKQVCTVLDVLLDDFINILKEIKVSHKGVVSEVLHYVVDYQTVDFMLWMGDNAINTFYPKLQADYWDSIKGKHPSVWSPGFNMPELYKVQNCQLEKCELANYGKTVLLPPGILMNVAKYTQLCQYLSKTTMCVPHNMRVMHFGAGSDKGVAPGTSVLRQWLPEGALLIDNDINRYVSDADACVISDCNVFKSQGKFDLIISDMYTSPKGVDIHEGIIKNNGISDCFGYLCHFIKNNLSLGGTFAVKITETSWLPELYELAQKCAYWTCFCTAVNTSSSEAFLVGVNYLGDVEKPIIDGSVMHANYLFWRNVTDLPLSARSLFDIAKFGLKVKATPVVNLKKENITELVINLLKNGKIVIRDSASVHYVDDSLII
uniref:ORF1ab polyprotein n=1 Tax=Bottlenose dolphin coronavirus HKU22 TaxID=1433215 RepID=V5TFR4_BWCOV|nr:replicase polyprotein [Bottlenose dolphin coronavirus HKU22]